MADVPAFEEWFDKLKKQAVEQLGYRDDEARALSEETWKEYYLDGYTPKDALKEHARTR